VSYIIDFNGYKALRPLNYIMRLRGTPYGVVDLSSCNSIEQHDVITTNQSTLGSDRQLKFNGTSSYIYITHTKNKIDTGEDFTLSLWVIQENMSRDRQVQFYFGYVGEYFESYPSFYMVQSNYITNYPNSYVISFGYHYQLGFAYPFIQNTPFQTPFHLAVVRKNGVTKCAMNGIFSNDSLSVNTDFLRVGSKESIGKASRGSFNYAYADMVLDDFCIIKGRALWTSDFTPPTEYLPDKW